MSVAQISDCLKNWMFKKHDRANITVDTVEKLASQISQMEIRRIFPNSEL